MDKEAQQPITEEDFDAPSDITPAYMQEKYRQGRGFTIFGVIVIASLCALSWLYDHYSELYYFRPGVALFNQHQYPAAQRDFQRYLHLENDPDGHYYLGRTFLAEGNTAEARHEFMQDGIRTNGNGRLRLNNRSASYLRQMPR